MKFVKSCWVITLLLATSPLFSFGLESRKIYNEGLFFLQANKDKIGLFTIAALSVTGLILWQQKKRVE